MAIKVKTVSKNSAHNLSKKVTADTAPKSVGNVETVTCYVLRSELKPAPFNPEIRTQLEYLKDLRESMQEKGFWEFAPILVDRNSVIIDGHRRWTVARILGIEKVPVTIVDGEADELWGEFNGNRMDMTGAQVMQAIAHGLKTRPDKFADNLAQLEDIVGEEGLKELGLQGNISPNIIKTARRIARYCNLREDKVFIGLTVEWLAKYRKMTSISARAMREDVRPESLERAIRASRILETSYN
jgi:hypothetical protein